MDVFAKLFSGEVCIMPFVYVVYCLVEEVFVPIYFHGVKRGIGGVNWGGYGVWYGIHWPC